jgi:predicted nucleic acid-binding protein
MVVVADTSPINYLILIDAIDLLASLYGQVLLPEAVAAELRHAETPERVRRWMQTPPRWISVQVAPRLNDSRLAELDPGERQAIALALEHGLSLILMDETKGRLKATSLKLRVRGTLGILEEAARRGEIDFMSALQKLEATTFRMTPSVREAAVRRAGS